MKASIVNTTSPSELHVVPMAPIVSTVVLASQPQLVPLLASTPACVRATHQGEHCEKAAAAMSETSNSATPPPSVPFFGE
jgi:hypothetical protein